MIETKIIVKPKGNSGTGNSSGAAGYGGEYVSEADYAARAGKAKKAESADLAMRANTANTADRAKYADKAGELDEEAEVLQRYIRKDIDDIAQGTVTWEKVQKLVSGLLVGNFNNENGGSWTPDAEGRSHLITDYLEVRMKAIFEELVIKKTSTIGGKEIISPAGGVVAHKVEEVTVTYNNVSQKAYRCYFLAEQEGDAVDNDFAIGDQVRSESFNVRKGTYHKVGNHFYWRLIIGRDEEPVELEGKKYHYIDLSDTDCATASDVPAKGDVLSQCGNRTDVERQNCLIFSAVDTYSPSIGLYHGINSYSFSNKEYVEYGVNKQTNKAFFNVYGDMYVGDRPNKGNGYEGSSYIKYDSATKQVVIKGKLSAKSTVDGKELSQYIKDNSAGGLTEEQVNNLIKNSQVIADLQNQVDGAIETWFYEGVPTLTNAPASSWTTDKDKDTHLGDLYYDNKTGKAYRFAKDGSTYKWTIITDTDIAKALSDASKAQETADGKMKVFSAQPTPPYQLGDIWVNATYPSDGSTYKNEVLRCQTDKKAGSQFAIVDWIKASKYTDDTVANAAKKAAEDAQKAAETAQTNVTNLGKTVTSNKKAFDSYVTDGYLEPSEIAAMAQDSKRLEDAFAAAEKSYNEVKGAEVLKDTKELTDLKTAFTTLSTAKTELVTYLSDISSRYNAADTKGKATIVSAVGTKFTNFQSAYSAFYDKLGLANAYITSKIYGDLKQNITDLAGYKYIKDALGQTTDIDGGLVMTTLLALRDADGNVQSGINGAIDPNRGKKSIATWWGGRMVDKDYNSGNLTPATSLVRFDGSGYLANGAIWWDVDGKVHADPTSFIISEKNLGAYLTFFEPTWKAGSAGTSVADLVSLKPNAPFSKLDVSGDASFEGAISFHGIKLKYDATNKAIKVDGNLYATGGISAYGASDAGGGGGLNASVISYARIIEGSYTDADLTSIPNAYAIKALSSRIDNIATELGGLNLSWNNITGKPSMFTPSAHTHKWADITDRITKVSQLTNDSGYTTNKGTVTSVKLTLPTGLSLGVTKEITTSGTFAISLTSGYSIPTTSKQGQWDSAYNWYKLMTTDEETADGVINKWNEVVNFLAGIAQTDTLDGILSGINNSITEEANRAKKAEAANATNIATNKANITTLQGYFTNGSAKSAIKLTNARKLWGNSFDGTADISGSIVVPSGKYISIGNIKMEYDATNKALKITNTTTNEVANLYTSGGVSAYGVGASTTGGGGLNGSVKSYSDALKLTSESLSEIASAYSIKQLSTRITSLEGGSATSISVSGSGNAVTSVTKNGTTISVVKGSTFLTSHQSFTDLCATLRVGDGVPTDDTEFVTSFTGVDGFHNNNALNVPYRRKASLLWQYIKGKTDTIYQPKGSYLTSHQDISGKVNKSGDTMTGDLSFSVESGASQTIYFKRGVNTSWGINVVEGNMIFRELRSNKVAFSINENSQGAKAYIYGQEIIHSGNIGSQSVNYANSAGNAATTTKLQTARKLWGNSFDGTNNIGGTILPSATHTYNLGSATYMFERTYTRYIDTDSGFDLRLLCSGNEVLRLGSVDKSVNINYDANISGKTIVANGLDVYNKNSHFCSVVITEFSASTNGGSINVIDTSGGAPNNRPLALQFGQGNVGIGTLSPSEKLEVKGNILVNDDTSNDRGLKIKAHSRDLLFGVGTSKKIGVYSYNDNKWLFYTDTSTFYTSGNILANGGLTVNNITMSNNSYLYGKNTSGTAIQLIAMASWNSVDIGRGALTNGYTTQVMGKTVALTASNDSGKNVKSVELSTAKLYSNVNIETEGGLLAHGGVTAYSSSDIRLKQDLRKLDYLSIIKAMGGTFSFAWKKDNTRSIGFIAQHVLCNPHLKDIVETDEKGYYKINYWSPKLIATAFGAIEQVGDEVSRLKARVVFLESEVQRLSGKQDSSNKKRLDNKNINLLN